MKTLFRCSTAALVAVAAAGMASAQSSGNFTYGNTGAGVRCVMDSGGNITGGDICSQSSVCDLTGCTILPGANDCIGSLNAGIKTNSGAGNVFVITPSAVIGLLTDVTVQRNTTLNVTSSSALSGVDFEVKVTAPDGTLATTIPSFPVTYDSRFVQISTNLFSVLTTQCATTTGCFFTFNESTVSAHSFQWIVPQLQSGVYSIAANWKASLGNAGISTSLTCVGPVNLTVQQNKVFSFNTVN